MKKKEKKNHDERLEESKIENKYGAVSTWMFADRTKNRSIYWCHQDHLFRAHQTNWMPTIFDSKRTSSWINSPSSRALHTITPSRTMAPYSISIFSTILIQNSDCNVWMTLGLPNGWNKFTFLWCFDTLHTILLAYKNSWIVYVRCKQSLNQSGLSVGFVACEPNKKKTTKKADTLTSTNNQNRMNVTIGCFRVI